MKPKLTAQFRRKTLWVEREDSDFTPIETLPAAFIPLVMPYAGIYFSREDDCEILSQNIKLADFSIWSHEIFTYEDILLTPQTPYQILSLHFIEVDNRVPGIFERELFLIKEKEVNLLNLHSLFHAAPIAAGNITCNFHINILPDALPALAKKFPELQHLTTMEIGMTSGPLNKRPYLISAAAQELITAILGCRFIEEQAKFFLHRCCADLFINFACQDRLSGKTNKMSPALQAIMSMLFDHLAENVQETFDIEQLAHIYEMPVAVLKETFEQMFFITPEAFAHQQKMMTVYNMLVQTKERLSAIAAATGFDDWQTMKQAFETYYGCTITNIFNTR
jgi:AraC-like DNA-binding protein